MDETARRRRAGHAFITRGWPVLPLAPGTSRPMACPLCRHGSPQYTGDHTYDSCPHEPDYCHGYRCATLDHARFDSWLDRFLNVNLGIATEAASLLVIDCDTPTGHAAITEPAFVEAGATTGEEVLALALARYRQPWPDTLTVTTPSFGVHYYWTLPPGLAVKSLNGRFGPLVDVKSAGAYIVAPTSRKPAGEYRRCSNTLESAPAPPWLLHHLRATGHMPEPPRPRRPVRTPPGAAVGSRGTDALTEIARRLEHAPAGTRHAALCTATTAAAHLVAERHVTENQAHAVVRDAALAAERAEREFTDAWRSALQKIGV